MSWRTRSLHAPPDMRPAGVRSAGGRRRGPGEVSVIMVGGVTAEGKPRYVQPTIRDHHAEHDHGTWQHQMTEPGCRRAPMSGPAAAGSPGSGPIGCPIPAQWPRSAAWEPCCRSEPMCEQQRGTPAVVALGGCNIRVELCCCLRVKSGSR